MKINNLTGFALLLALTLTITACSNSEEANDESVASTPSEQPLILDVEISEARNPPEFIGFTNLPDGTQLQYGIFRPDIGFFTGGKVDVSTGSFSFQLKGNEGTVPPPGQYKVTVSTPMSSMQPHDIQELVGEDYRNFTGPLIDGSSARPTISYEKQVKLSGSAPNEDLLELRKRRLKELTAQVEESCSTIVNMELRIGCVEDGVAKWRTAMGLKEVTTEKQIKIKSK